MSVCISLHIPPAKLAYSKPTKHGWRNPRRWRESVSVSLRFGSVRLDAGMTTTMMMMTHGRRCRRNSTPVIRVYHSGVFFTSDGDLASVSWLSRRHRYRSTTRLWILRRAAAFMCDFQELPRRITADEWRIIYVNYFCLISAASVFNNDRKNIIRSYVTISCIVALGYVSRSWRRTIQ